MRQAPKYFVSAASVIKTPEPISRQKPLRSIPSIHSPTAHTQKASINVSHISVVLETRNTGVNNVAHAASMGWLQK